MINIGELLLCKNINMLCEYICYCYVFENYAMISYNVSMNMLCRVGDLIWRICAFVMHHLCTNFDFVVCSGPMMESGVSS